MPRKLLATHFRRKAFEDLWLRRAISQPGPLGFRRLGLQA